VALFAKNHFSQKDFCDEVVRRFLEKGVATVTPTEVRLKEIMNELI